MTSSVCSGYVSKLFTSAELGKTTYSQNFLPEKNLSTYNFRKPRVFKNFKARKSRFKNIFFPALTISYILIFTIQLEIVLIISFTCKYFISIIM